jgi:hypothetical protein
MIFDLFSHEYGWTTEYILSRTTRELDYRMKAMNKRLQSNYQFQAALADKQFKLDRASEKDDTSLTQEEEVALDQALKQARTRKLTERVASG